jgi:hypothetical protein
MGRVLVDLADVEPGEQVRTGADAGPVGPPAGAQLAEPEPRVERAAAVPDGLPGSVD